MHKTVSHDLYTWEIFLIHLTNEAIHDIIKKKRAGGVDLKKILKVIILILLSCAAVVGIFAGALWIYDRVGSYPFWTLQQRDVAKITISTGITTEYTIADEDFDDAMSIIRNVHIGRRVKRKDRYDFFGGAWGSIRLYLSDGIRYDITYSASGQKTLFDERHSNFIGYVTIDGKSYTSYDTANQRAFEKLVWKYTLSENDTEAAS